MSNIFISPTMVVTCSRLTALWRYIKLVLSLLVVVEVQYTCRKEND